MKKRADALQPGDRVANCGAWPVVEVESNLPAWPGHRRIEYVMPTGDRQTSVSADGVEFEVVREGGQDA